MADQFRQHDRIPQDIVRQFKDLGTTDPQGRPVYAEVLALEPNSIGAGGGGPASAVSIADGVSSAIKATVTGALALKVDPSGVTQPISAASLPLPTGAATETTLAAVNTKLPASMVAVNNADNDAGRVGLVVDGRNRVWNGAGWDRMPGTTAGSYALIRVAGATVDPRDRNWTITETVPVSGTFWQATQPVSGTFWQATQPISAASLPLPTGASTETTLAAVRDRLPTALTVSGNLKVALVESTAAQAVTGTFWQATQPVSGTFWQATQPISAASLPLPTGAATEATLAAVSGKLPATLGQKAMAASLAVVVASDQSNLPTNLAQVGGAAFALKALPTNADGLAAIPVYPNSIQLATYDAGARAIVSGALTANTAKAILSIEHAVTATKTVKIRRIIAHMIQTTALSGLIEFQVQTGTAASSAGTARTPSPRKKSDPAAEAVVKTLPTITAATLQDTWPAGGFATTTTLYSPPIVVFDWQENGEAKPLMLRAGVLETIVINVISSAAHNLTIAIAIDFTEE